VSDVDDTSLRMAAAAAAALVAADDDDDDDECVRCPAPLVTDMRVLNSADDV